MSVVLIATGDTADLLEASGSSGTVASSTAQVHSAGGSSYRFNLSGAAGALTFQGKAADGSNVALAESNLFISIAWYVSGSSISAAQNLYTITNASGQIMALLQLQTDDTWKLIYINGSNGVVQIGSASAAMAKNAWNTVEFAIQAADTAAGATVSARLNGTQFASQGSLTIRSVQAKCANLVIGQSVGSYTVDYYVDDIVGDNAAYPGPCATQVLVPDGAGNLAQWTGGTGSTFAEVDEVDGSHANDGDTTYIKTSAGNNSDFNLSNTTGVLGPIKAVVGYMITRDEGGASLVQVKISQASANALTTQADPGSTYVYRAKIASVSPTTGVAWTQSEVDAARIEVESGAAVAIRVTAMGLFVIYRPDQTISPPEATATAQGEVPAIGATLPAVAATATAQGEVPALGATLPAVAATATAQAEVPTIIDQASIAPPEATATAQAETPTMTASWTAVEATATAQGEVPVLNATLAAVEATATAQAEVPRIEAGAAFGVGPFIGSASKAMLSIGKATRSILARGTATAFRPARGSARIRRPGDLP